MTIKLPIFSKVMKNSKFYFSKKVCVKYLFLRKSRSFNELQKNLKQVAWKSVMTKQSDNTHGIMRSQKESLETYRKRIQQIGAKGTIAKFWNF